tara:strand:- start:603 stop:839 length:237 start_codon:yes stop_codon:yes gene_type:complete
MKQQKKVIKTNELPTKFGWSFWIILYLLLDKFDATGVLWVVGCSLFVVWIFLFGLIKNNEKSFSILSLKSNIEKWVNS